MLSLHGISHTIGFTSRLRTGGGVPELVGCVLGRRWVFKVCYSSSHGFLFRGSCILTNSQGLLPLLKSIQRPTELKKFSGETFGVDAYGWLHRGAVSCAIELAEGKPTRR